MNKEKTTIEGEIITLQESIKNLLAAANELDVKLNDKLDVHRSNLSKIEEEIQKKKNEIQGIDQKIRRLKESSYT